MWICFIFSRVEVKFAGFKEPSSFEILWIFTHLSISKFPAIVIIFLVSSLFEATSVATAPPPEYPIRLKSLFLYFVFLVLIYNLTMDYT